MSDDRRKQLGNIRRAATIVELRLRVARGLRVLPPTLTGALAVAAVTLAVRKVLPSVLDNRRAWEILIAAGAFVALSVVVAMLRRLPPRAGAVALDKHHALHGRLTNALAFDGTPERSPLMEVAIDDACEHAGKLSPRHAAPIPVPRDLLGSAAVLAGVAAIAMLHVPVGAPPPAPQAKLIDAVQLSPDDVELFRSAAQELGKKDQSPEVKAALEKFNQLIEDIAQKRIDRAEAFRRMEQIERELVKGTEADAKAFEEALKRTSEDLKTSELAKPLAESLSKKNLDQAKKDLKALASQLREQKEGKKKIDKAALDRLRQALERASKQRKEALAAVQEKRNEAHEQREQLLKKKEQNRDPDAGAPNPEDERLLKKKERELERLDRDMERAARDQRRLDRLDRELGKAAQDLMKDLGLSAEDLEQAAEDINRMQDEQMSEKEKEELRQRLEELREQLRQQGQGGKERMKRMLKFGKRARGGKKGSGQKGKDGQPGKDGDDGDEGDGKDGEGGDKDGEGKDGQGKDGQGKDGQGGKGGHGKGLTLKLSQAGSGAGGIPIPGGGAGQGESGGQGQGQDSPGGGPGKGIGTSHDPNVMGKRTDMKSGTADVQEQGLDTKQGPSNSEVILGAAERGFRGSGYKKVFTDYHTRAEDQINKDQVPDGYRFYVHRYFQLIRPRDGEEH